MTTEYPHKVSPECSCEIGSVCQHRPCCYFGETVPQNVRSPLVQNEMNQAIKSPDWHAGFAAAKYQASREMGHFIVDEWDREDIAGAVWVAIEEMVWNPECKEETT